LTSEKENIDMLILKKVISPIMLLVLLLTVLPVLSDLQSQYPAASSALQDGSNLSTAAQELDPAAKSKVMQAYGNLPLLFIANSGQVDSSVFYYANVAGGRAYLTSDSIVLDLIRKEANSAPDMVAVPDSEAQQEAYQRLVMRLNFQGANGNPEVICRDMAQGKVNYLIGNNPSKWLTDIPTYQEIVYQDIYPNIDLRLCGREGMLTYDFIVRPGGKVNDIRLALEGIDSLELSGRDLVLNTAFGELRQERLSIYQGDGAGRTDIEGNFRLLGDNSYGFAVAAYDSNNDLVIDPSLIYSTYLGGTGQDYGYGIAVDAAGSAYVTGYTSSNPFPTTLGAFQTGYAGGALDAFVTKLNPTGSALVYSTYLGGSGADYAYSIAVDATGNAYVCGYTNNGVTSFPTTLGAYQTIFGGSYDVFVTKLNADGKGLVYSTFLGGTGDDRSGNGIAVDAAGNAYVCGFTASDNTTFPLTSGAFQTTYGGGAFDAFVTKLNPTATAPLLYSTYLGGGGNDYAQSVAVDTAGNAYVTGYTSSNDFPNTPGVFQPALNASLDAFVTKLNPTGTAPLIYSTYLGGSGDDRGIDIAIDAAGNAYVTGYTSSIAATFPWTPGAFQTAYGGGAYDAFVTKLNPTATAPLVYCTYLGGSGEDQGLGIAIDATGNACVTGYTHSNDFPNTPGAYQTTLASAPDAFISRLNATGTAPLLYSTYLGGTNIDGAFAIDMDAAENAYLTGYTASSPFPTTPGAYQTAFGASIDAFVSKFRLVDQPTASVTTATGTGTATFTTSNGSIADLTAAANTPCGTPPSLNFPHGFFSYNINGVPAGSTVTITITLPSPMPVGTQYWKCINSQWVDVTSLLGDDDGDNVLTLALTDGGLGDADGAANGTIVDPGGPAVAAATAQVPAGPRASSTPPRTLNPPQMSLQYLSVNPQQASANQPVTIITNVVNTGDEGGNYNVALKINGQVEQSRMVSVGPQGTQPVKFTVAKAQPGTYTVDIGGQKGSFTINGAGGTTGKPVNGGLIAILIVGVMVLATIVALISTRRRPA
jgi:hypothetical protein